MTLAAPPELLRVEELTVVYETARGTVRAVSDVSFQVNRGEVLALVGESGCGKSTVALAIMRLVPPPGRVAGGRIRLEADDLLDLSDEALVSVRGKRIAMVFQNPLVSLNPVYRSGSQVKEAIALDQAARLDAWRKAVDIMGQVRIPDAAERALSYPHELSGGMRQRVMTGMMISRSPDLLIADEPTTALDVTIQAQVLELLLDLRRRNQMSLLIITHNLGVVAEIADRVAVMYAGSIVEQADVFDLYERPLHPYSRLLLRALPRLGKGEGRLETIPGNVPNLVEAIAGCPFHPRCPQRLPVCTVTVPKARSAGPGRQVACHLVEADRS
jgi:oligopeptide/dipeptide ABC transporter ATP-binding protein